MRRFKGDQGLSVIQRRKTAQGIRGEVNNPAGELVTRNTIGNWWQSISTM
jgi:hypothetical protein